MRRGGGAVRCWPACRATAVACDAPNAALRASCGHFPGNRALTRAIHSLCPTTHGECPMYSLVTGAAATGVNRSTILRTIKAGKLSAERDGSGAWVIQPVELHRLFPPLPQLPAVVEPVQNAGHSTEVPYYALWLGRCGQRLPTCELIVIIGARFIRARSGYCPPQSPRTPRMRTGSSGRGNGRGDGSAKVGRSRAGA
jgi:hypothetical protein